MKAVVDAVKKIKNYDEAHKCLEEAGAMQLSAVSFAQQSPLIYTFGEDKTRKIVISYSEQRARELMADYRFYDKKCVYYPAKDFLFYKANLKGGELEKERMQVYKHLIEDGSLTVFTVMDALMDGLLSREVVTGTVLHIKMGDTFDPEKLKSSFADMGYERCYQVEAPGQFAARGGILDVYPLTGEVAYRIEFFDDEIDSVRSFDPSSQRSLENIDEVEIYPSESDALKGDKSFLDYFDKKDTMIFLDDGTKGFGLCKETREELEESIKHRSKRGDETEDITLFGEPEIWKKLTEFPVCNFSALDNVMENIDAKKVFSVNMTDTPHYVGRFDELVNDLKGYKRRGFKVLFTSASKLRAARLARDLIEYDLNAFYSEDEAHEIKDGEIMVTGAALSQGIEMPDSRFAIITDSDVFGREKKFLSVTG